MKRLLTSTAMIFALGTAAVAQTATDTATDGQVKKYSEEQAATPSADTGAAAEVQQVLASRHLDADLAGSDAGEDVGGRSEGDLGIAPVDQGAHPYAFWSQDRDVAPSQEPAVGVHHHAIAIHEGVRAAVVAKAAALPAHADLGGIGGGLDHHTPTPEPNLDLGGIRRPVAFAASAGDEASE